MIARSSRCLAIRVLLLSYLFPPTPLAEAYVTAKTMGATGYPTDVLCVDSRTWNLPADVVLGRYAEERFCKVVRKRFRGGRTLLRMQWRVPMVCDVPDAMLYFWPAARRAALGMVPGHDVLVTRSQLHSVHLTGLSVKGRHPTLPWVASFSDPWTGSRAPDRTALTRFVNSRMEAEVLEACDIAVFTSEQAADYTMRRHPQLRTPVRIVPHSFDPVLFDPPTEPSDDHVMLRYCGYFDRARTPEPLLRALGCLLERRPDLATRIRVELVGGTPRGALETRAGQGLPAGMVTTRDPVSYRASLQLMRDASVLLVVDADQSQPAAGTYLPSKLIDYIGAGRPIVAFSPPGAAAQVVAALGGAVASPDDPHAGADALERSLGDAAGTGQTWGTPEVRERFHVRRIGAQWRSILDEVAQ